MARSFNLRWAVLGCVVLVSACGSQVPHDTIRAAWNHDGAGAAVVPEAPPGASGDVVPSDGAAVPASPGSASSAASIASPAARSQSVNPSPAARTAATSVGALAPGLPPAAGSNAGPASSTVASVAPGVPAPTKAEIVIGNVSTLSGPVGAATSGGPKAASAWVASVNARGGINGYRIRLKMADDGSDPARHRSLIQEMVERNGAIAFLHNASSLGGGAAVSYIQEKRIPVIGSEGGSYWVNQNSMYFPQMPSLTFLPPMEAGALAQIALPQGKKKLAMFVCEFQSCDSVVGADDFTKAGFTVVHNAKVSITQPDYTAECLAARNAGADIVFFMLTPDGVIRFAESCKNVGLAPLYSFVYVAISPLLLQRPELDGAIWASPTAPFFFQDHPSIAEFGATMARFAPGVTVDASAATGWVSAKLFEKVLLRTTVARPGPADILKGLWSIDNDDLGGITMPLTFREGEKNNATHVRSCWWTVRILNHQWVSADGGQRHCA
jgi:branched-chain amino acid transport system substrate-binding protein